MNVLFVSECSGRAMAETRRILDQFAERRGERSWHTPTTYEGLKAIHRTLRSKARKNTAVACFWLRRGRADLQWIVGNVRRFNEDGSTPTNRTSHDILRSGDESGWRHAEVIVLLAEMAGLFHDFGKANAHFQARLKGGRAKKDPYRHEWVSLRMFAALVGDAVDDAAWLERLADEKADLSAWEGRLVCDDAPKPLPRYPLEGLPPLAQAIGWLVLTHHRLPVRPKRETVTAMQLESVLRHISVEWAGSDLDSTTKKAQRMCWKFGAGTPFDSASWRRMVGNTARRMLRLGDKRLALDWLDELQSIHLARLSLILADHHYSAQPSRPDYGDRNFPTHANTERSDGSLKQRLDEHLIGVGVNARKVARSLPLLTRKLPRLARHRGFRKRAAAPHFKWQDRAFDLAEGLRDKAEEQGFFGVNMASTGTGKTFANGRVLYALANARLGARFTVAVGLRSLTLQTGRAYRDRLSLDQEDLAILVGGGAMREMHERARVHGSESSESLLPEQSHVHVDSGLEQGPLADWLSKQASALLNAPIAVCTIDHLMPATEGIRGGRHILPLLRLLTSDLVIDEVDDFGPPDLYAVSRLVHFAGMLGSRVLLSSATLPPALVEGLFAAYLAGRGAFIDAREDAERQRGVSCAWFDEFSNSVGDCADQDGFRRLHDDFVARRVKTLSRQPIRRHARVIEFKRPEKSDMDGICDHLARLLRWEVPRLHRENAQTDPKTGKRVSVGLVRMANIDPLVKTARSFVEKSPAEGLELHVSAYHSQFPLLRRHILESRLDRILQRKDGHTLFEDTSVRAALDGSLQSTEDLAFMVFASPVAEVGRDHDYDWAIVEPSSMRALIQLAGRVRRHRREVWSGVNLSLLSTNVKALKTPGTPAYCRPGFESSLFRLDSHELEDLLSADEIQRIDATWRIRDGRGDPRRSLSALEHSVLKDMMLGAEKGKQKRRKASEWWETQAHLIGALQSQTKFRAGSPTRGYWLLPEDKETGGGLVLHCRDDSGNDPKKCGYLVTQVDAVPLADGCHWWGEAEDWALLRAYIDKHGIDDSEWDAALKYMTVDLRVGNGGEALQWDHYPMFGFFRSH